MTIFYIGVALLVFAGLYLLITGWRKEKRQTKRISELEREVDRLRNRRMTASGGLSLEDKLKVLDLIAITDTIEDDNKLIQLRVADLKRRLIEILNKKEIKR